MVRVILVDDHNMMREGLALILHHAGGIEVVGQASDGHAALDLAASLQPDVLVMDVGMPNLNGVEATRQILAANPSIKVIGLSALADRRYAAGMLQAGACAYVVKSAAGDELVSAIRAVIRGKRFISAEIARMPSPDAPRTSLNAESATKLSGREREILQRLAEGQTSNRIANALCISSRTVETHRRNLMRKLGLHNLAELTRYAIREGLTQVQ